MQRKLNVLFLEDVATDAELALWHLRRAGIDCNFRCVANEADFRRELEQFPPDLILSDFSIPGFDALLALDIARQMCPDTPYLFVSGTIGEERAIESIKRGATDYVLKTNLARLGPAVSRALDEARERSARKQAEHALRSSEERFRLLVNGVADHSIVLLGPSGEVVSWNTGAERIYGYREDEIVGKHFSLFYPPNESGMDEATQALHVAASSGRFSNECWRIRKDGSTFWANVGLTALRSETGALGGFAEVTRDVSERKTHMDRIARLSRIHAVLSGINSAIIRIRDRQELFNEACRIAVEHGGFGVAWLGTLDPGTRIVTPVAAAGAEAQALIHIEGPTSLDSYWGEGIAGRALAQKRPIYSNDLMQESSVGGARRKEALRRGYRSVVVLPLIVGDNVVGNLTLFAKEPDFFNDEELKLLGTLAADISFALDHIAKEERINYLAYFDALTGLPNRALFLERLTRSLHAAASAEAKIALLLGDIQRFRIINESLGRSAGDALLQEVTARLRRAWAGKGDLARVGPDTFAIVISEVRDEAHVAHALMASLADVHAPAIDVGAEELHIALTTGIGLFPDDATDADTLFRNAEAALNKAKQSGAPYLFYEPEMNARVARTLSLENKLRRAIEREQFVLHYQPKIHLQDNRVVGLEALIRWNDPDAGLIPPAQFIPILEETGMILEVGRWSLQQAVRDYTRWRARGVAWPRVAVNVSAIQLRQADFAEVVKWALRSAGAAAHGLDLEITESLAMENVADTIPKLRAVKEQGVQISIDDFGTGYSSLGYISRLPVDSLKIDRSFIVSMTNSADDMKIVSTVIALAHDLRLEVIAEGVDAQEQAQLLRLLNCDQMQGYLFSRPVPAEAIESLLGPAPA